MFSLSMNRVDFGVGFVQDATLQFGCCILLLPVLLLCLISFLLLIKVRVLESLKLNSMTHLCGKLLQCTKIRAST